MAKPVRLTVILLCALLVVGYLVGVFLMRDIWTGRDATRATFAAQMPDSSPASPEAMTKAQEVVKAQLGFDAEVTVEGSTLVATYPGRELSSETLRDMFGPGDAKKLYIRPVIHAIPASPEPPPTSRVPVPPTDPAQVIADEKQLRQTTDQQIQILGLQFQATR